MKEKIEVKINEEVCEKLDFEILKAYATRSDSDITVTAIVCNDSDSIVPMECKVGIVFLNKEDEAVYVRKSESYFDYDVIYETFNIKFLEGCISDSVESISSILLYPMRVCREALIGSKW